MKVNKGFTLIELMVVIAIVAIIISVAYPSYQDSIVESRRTTAEADLMGLAQAMERYYTNNGTYVGATAAGIFSSTSPVDGSDVYYNLSVTSATSNSYVLTADPVNAQDGDGELTLAATGARGWDSDNSGTVDNDEECWDTSCD